jgi:hypothetical protein
MVEDFILLGDDAVPTSKLFLMFQRHTFKRSGTNYRVMWCHIPEEQTPHTHICVLLLDFFFLI